MATLECVRTLRAFLRPGWVIGILLVIAFAVACFLVLAPWQLGKNSSTEHRNDLIRSASQTPAVPLDEVAPPGTGFDPETEWREVTLRGTYLPEDEVVVRLRSAGERPAVEVLTPLALTGSDRVVLVNRGWLRPDEQQAGIPAAPAGEVSVNARIRANEGTTPDRGSHTDNGALSVYSIDSAEVAAATGLPLEPWYAQIVPGQPGALGEITLPQLSTGPYLSYGLQWLAFGVMAPLGVGYFIYSEIKHRRRDAVAGSGGDGDGGDGATAGRDTGKRPQSTARARRNRLQDELRAASTTAADEAVPVRVPEQRIGHGPSLDSTDDAAAEKLAHRYGS